MTSDRRPLGRDEEPPRGSAVIVHDGLDSQVWHRSHYEGPDGSWWAAGSGRTWGVTWEYILDMIAEPDNTSNGPYLLVEVASDDVAARLAVMSERYVAVLDAAAGYEKRMAAVRELLAADADAYPDHITGWDIVNEAYRLLGGEPVDGGDRV